MQVRLRNTLLRHYKLIIIVVSVAAVVLFFFFQAEDGIRDYKVTGVQTCALPICSVLPWAGEIVVSHWMEPSFALTAATLPLSNPQRTRSPVMTGQAVPRKDRRGNCCSCVPSSLPSFKDSPRSFPSTVRTATSFSPT